MIVQGTNLPIRVIFEEDASNFSDISVVLTERSSARIIKSWAMSDMIIDGTEVTLPIEQSDLFPPNLSITEDLNVAIELKWMTPEDTIENAATVYDYISYRKDTRILTES